MRKRAAPRERAAAGTAVKERTAVLRGTAARKRAAAMTSLIHITEPTRQAAISYAVFCLKKNMISINYTHAL